MEERVPEMAPMEGVTAQGLTDQLLEEENMQLEEEVYRAFAPLCPNVLLTALHTDKPSLESIFLDITGGHAVQEIKPEGGERA